MDAALLSLFCLCFLLLNFKRGLTLEYSEKMSLRKEGRIIEEGLDIKNAPRNDADGSTIYNGCRPIAATNSEQGCPQIMRIHPPSDFPLHS